MQKWYVLTDGTYYIRMTETGRIIKTLDVHEAKYFNSEVLAEHVRSSCTKKCKGFYIDTLGGSRKKRRKNYSPDVKRMVYIKSGGRCSICGKRMDLNDCNLDHRIPLSKGGIDAVENLDYVHVQCNLIKSNLLPDELEKETRDIFLYQMEKNSGHRFRCKIAKLMLRKIC